jgi:serine/threonine protein kinase
MACLTPEQIELLAREALEPSEAEGLRRHIEQCDECRQKLEEAQANERVLRKLKSTPGMAGEESGDALSPEETIELQGQDMLPEHEGGGAPQAPEGPPPDSFSGYEILKEIHRGGQGVVYQAIQKATKRKVAVKVLLEGPYASKSALKRFEREIELIAQLKHPNIISILHSGTTADGQQFYVMDYVRGTPLNQYVHQKQLTLEETLKLFATVCEAVQYAHQKGVIHRDLKPSNIVVDAQRIPRILDFGLAKWLAAPVDTLVSVSQELIGTLPYMSPEQVRGNPDEIDTRTDIYALGVILYELLTGHYPYPVVGQMADTLKHIAETPPTPPNRAWRSDSGITKRSSKRLRSGKCPIDHEVQTVVLCALAKERERRYQSAGELARDIDCYLAGEPIGAKRDSRWYILKKSVRRYKLPMAIAASFVLLLATSLAAISGLYLRAERARQLAAKVIDHWSTVWFQARNENGSAAIATLRSGLDFQRQLYPATDIRHVNTQVMLCLVMEDVFLTRPRSDLFITAGERTILGPTSEIMEPLDGNFEDWIAQCRSTLSLLEGLAGADSIAPEKAEARPSRTARRVGGNGWPLPRAVGEVRFALANALGQAALQRLSAGENEAAERMLREAIELDKKSDVWPVDDKSHPLGVSRGERWPGEKSRRLGILGEVLRQSGACSEIPPLLSEGLARWSSIWSGGEVADLTTLEFLTRVLLDVANDWPSAADASTLERTLNEFREAWRRLPYPEDFRSLGEREIVRAFIQVRLHYDETEAFLTAQYRTYERSMDRYGGAQRAAELLVELYEAWGRPEEAAEWRAKLGKAGVTWRIQQLNNQSVQLREAGRLDEAEMAIREALALARDAYGDEAHARTQIERANLAAVLVRAKKFEEAEGIALEIHGEGWKGFPGFDIRLLVELYEGWGKEEKAAEWRAKLSTPGVSSQPSSAVDKSDQRP